MLAQLLRTFILYICVIFAIRLMGKRQLGELQPSEFVVTLLISDLAVVPMQDIGIPILIGVVPIVVLIFIEILLSVLSLKSQTIRTIITGKSVPVIEDGKLIQKNLKRLRKTSSDILEELRLKDQFDLNEVIYAQIETNGKLSVLVSNASQKNIGYATAIISDGKLQEDNLKKSGKDMIWVKNYLENQNITNIKDVFLLTVDKYDNTILLRKDSN